MDRHAAFSPPALTTGTQAERNGTESARLAESGFVPHHIWWAADASRHKRRLEVATLRRHAPENRSAWLRFGKSGSESAISK